MLVISGSTAFVPNLCNAFDLVGENSIDWKLENIDVPMFNKNKFIDLEKIMMQDIRCC